MSLKLCPLCVQVNPTSANFCCACGLTLVAPGAPGNDAQRKDEVDTVSGGLDDLNLTLRSLDEVGEHQAVAGARRTREPGVANGAESAAGAGQGAEAAPAGLIRSDPDAEFERPASARSGAKAARRALVRRAVLATAAQQTGACPVPTDVLVMDENDGDRWQLCDLLEGFGFAVRATQHVADADALLDAQAFAAVFLAIVLDGSPQGAAAHVCQHVRRAPSQTTDTAPALIIVAEHARSVDRVRAALVGAGAFLQKPMSRGELVRALLDCGVPLPLDARRA